MAYPKVGKSTFASQLAVAVAQGRHFLGRPTRQGGVLYIVAEERRDDVMRRLRHFGMTDDDPICLWTETATDTQADQRLIRDFLPKHNITLVVIDTWASYLMIPDESNNSWVTTKMKPYVDMAHDSGATILFVHHERKNHDNESGDDTRAIRGGGQILGLADLAFQLQKKEGGGGNRRRLKIVGRYSEIPQTLELDYRDDEYVCLGTPEEFSRTAQRDKAVAVLPVEEPGLTVAEIAKKAELSLRAARIAADDGYATNLAHRTGTGHKGDPFRYRLVARPATDTRMPAASESESSDEVAVHA